MLQSIQLIVIITLHAYSVVQSYILHPIARMVTG